LLVSQFEFEELEFELARPNQNPVQKWLGADDGAAAGAALLAGSAGVMCAVELDVCVVVDACDTEA
jgi:hypothetical protein